MQCYIIKNKTKASAKQKRYSSNLLESAKKTFLIHSILFLPYYSFFLGIHFYII